MKKKGAGPNDVYITRRPKGRIPTPYAIADCFTEYSSHALFENLLKVILFRLASLINLPTQRCMPSKNNSVTKRIINY